MPATIDEIKSKAEKIKAMYGDRDTVYNEIMQMYALEDSSLPSDEDIVKVISPDARNKILGMVRLLTATDPKWSVPADVNDPDNMDASSAVEKAAAAMWKQAGRVRGRPIEKDAVLAGGLFSLVSIAVKLTNDIVTVTTDPIQKARAEKAYARTPILWTVLNPQSCYPLFDDFGLAAHYFKRQLTAADVIAKHGEAAANLLAGQELTKLVEYNEYWDWEMHAVWLDAGEIMCEPHNLKIMPIACKVIEGSDIFESKYQIMPFLYGLDKSGAWKAQSRSLTAMFTNTFNTATSPMSVYHAQDKAAPAPQVDYGLRGGVVVVGTNEDLTPFQRQAIDPALQDTYNLARNMVEESTIYSQTLGQPLGSDTYSTVALLSQAGRLPLVPYQEMLSEVIGEAMQIGMMMLRDNGKGSVKVPSYNKDGKRQAGIVEFDPQQYQDDMELQATLDISMPQDERGNAQVAQQLTDSRLISKQTAMERFLNIGQPDDEINKMWSEQYDDAMAEMRLQSMIQQAQAQGQPQQGAPQGQPMPPQGMPQGGPVTQTPTPQYQAAQSGLPMTGPIPEQMQGGQEGLPPEMMGGGM